MKFSFWALSGDVAMLISFNELEQLRNQVAMVDGGFDPLHHGHIEYFRCAKELGVAVLCNVTGDNYISEKHPVVLSSEKRAAVR
jgi:cytidyltransferase-like protein